MDTVFVRMDALQANLPPLTPNLIIIFSPHFNLFSHENYFLSFLTSNPTFSQHRTLLSKWGWGGGGLTLYCIPPLEFTKKIVAYTKERNMAHFELKRW